MIHTRQACPSVICGSIEPRTADAPLARAPFQLLGEAIAASATSPVGKTRASCWQSNHNTSHVSDGIRPGLKHPYWGV